jgi:Ca2+-binding RTX toxin-like protein
VLDRRPDPGGLAAWTGALNSGNLSRPEVVLGFSQSVEFRAGTAAALTTYMRGLGVDDELRGGPGADILFGGLGADHFVFDRADAGTGTDRVAGIEAWDWIRLDNVGYGSQAEALSHFSQKGADTLVRDLGMTNSFEDTSLAEIHLVMLIV